MKIKFPFLLMRREESTDFYFLIDSQQQQQNLGHCLYSLYLNKLLTMQFQKLCTVSEIVHRKYIIISEARLAVGLLR